MAKVFTALRWAQTQVELFDTLHPYEMGLIC